MDWLSIPPCEDMKQLEEMDYHEFGFLEMVNVMNDKVTEKY